MIRIGKYWLNPDKIVCCEYDRHDLVVHLEPPADTGEKRLLVAILRQVLLDCSLRLHQAQAEAWLRSRDCDALCELLDFDADQVRQLVQQDLPGLRNRLGKM